MENRYGLKKQHSDLQIKATNVESNTSAKMTNFSNQALSPINSQIPFMNESDMQTLNARNYDAQVNHEAATSTNRVAQTSGS